MRKHHRRRWKWMWTRSTIAVEMAARSGRDLGWEKRKAQRRSPRGCQKDLKKDPRSQYREERSSPSLVAIFPSSTAFAHAALPCNPRLLRAPLPLPLHDVLVIPAATATVEHDHWFTGFTQPRYTQLPLGYACHLLRYRPIGTRRQFGGERRECGRRARNHPVSSSSSWLSLSRRARFSEVFSCLWFF